MKMCVPFTYAGCGGNGNNFGTSEECAARCGVGKCIILRYKTHNYNYNIGYDWRIKMCVPFTYAGCGGNGNNFGTSEECAARCGVGKCVILSE
ncbi:Kunitz/Bovine pancreatic trypsin inhibitor domain protein [Oesophagostomum dentatum]|uniref:Kunitz/Bovine pancreatic trypsin inhibitor domain protein n=1 Tax=Oesophagostomum dentatum TaxID=61180 RepID=A0A0B1TD48_OESDE|nr:Kunitz/Bovine pancreatic trypsin inhibitor domain protein [Oesophagostomum dentatum]